MTKKKKLFEVDFIGGQGSLTLVEEKALNEFFQKAKAKTKIKPKGKNKTENKQKQSTV